MGACSTKHITRDQALEVIHNWAKYASNKDLEDLIDTIWAKALYNCLIVPKGVLGDDR